MSIKKTNIYKNEKNAIMDEIEKKYWENGWNWLNNWKLEIQRLNWNRW
jgi:hypothetical protein